MSDLPETEAKPARRRSYVAPIAIGIAALAGGFGALPRREEPTRLTFLSVGQGDCTVFQTGGHTILIDAGPNTRGSDAGKRIVLPDLRKMGIDSIDLILLSHPDLDHIGGLGALLKGVRVGKVGVSSWFRKDEEFRANLAAMGCGEDRLVWLGNEQEARVGAFTLEVACPEWHEGEDDNDGSEFVRIGSGAASAVFTGDASAMTEERMSVGRDWSAQLLHAGHHGSYTASGDAWLKAVHPQWAIISCGRNNSYGHPHPSVLRRLQQQGIRVARTDQEGDIAFELGPSGWQRTGVR